MDETLDTPMTDAPSSRWLPAVVAIVIFSMLSLLAGFGSDAFLEADAVLHYLYARFALAEPYRFVDVWGRPICTAVYAIPAALMGRTGTRLTSLALALGIAWIAMRIARRQGYRWPTLALIFTLGQPLVFTHSFTELTELPFALLVGAAFLAYQARWFAAMALLVSLTPLARPEGFGFILMAFAALALHRRWSSILILPLGVLIWSLAGWQMYGQEGTWWRWLPDHWPYAATSTYQPGYLLHFIASLPAIVSPLVFPATVAGIVLTFGLLRGRDGWRAFFNDHRFRCEILIAAIPLSILVVHSLLYWRGKMASNGELRYMLCVAPFWGVLAARGFQWACKRLAIRRVHLIAGAFCVLPACANFFYKVLPLGMDRDNQIAQRAATWLNEHPDPSRPFIMVSHPMIFYFLDASPTDRARVKDLNADTIVHPPVGTRLIWDSVYGQFNADRSRVVGEQMIVESGWEPDPALQAILDSIPGEKRAGWDARFHLEPTRWRAFVSRPKTLAD